jgi:hypothetical protein
MDSVTCETVNRVHFVERSRRVQSYGTGFLFMEEVFTQLGHTLVTVVTLKAIIAVTHVAEIHLLQS